MKLLFITILSISSLALAQENQNMSLASESSESELTQIAAGSNWSYVGTVWCSKPRECQERCESGGFSDYVVSETRNSAYNICSCHCR
jgi:hypothetical protein